MPIPIPQSPNFSVPWSALQQFEWVRALKTCPQDSLHHAEGNVWIHTRMVLETLIQMPAWKELDESARQVVFLACLLHDVAKPETTRQEDDGRVTAKGHSRRGEQMARRILWELNVPFAIREHVCGLIRFHQIPFYLIERNDAQKLAAEISLVTRCDWLALVAEADIRGRICQDTNRILDNIELYREFCKEEDCFSSPRRFPSAHTRFLYFRSENRAPDVEMYDDTQTQVIVMSGLPGAGKDTLIHKRWADWPMISLDALREELDIDPTENQGQIVQLAKERAREYLRRKEPFLWNATNLTRQRRHFLIQLLAEYRAHITIVYVEAPSKLLFHQNRSRLTAVPETVMYRYIDQWEVPDLTEAHMLEYSLF